MLGAVDAVLIVNPYASRVDERRVEAVRTALGGVEVQRTEAPGHATELARAAEDRAAAVFVFSGDGGFNEVVNGLTGRVPVGFVPGGGTSVAPRSLGLPRDPVEAARRIALGRTRRISVGKANGRRFLQLRRRARCRGDPAAGRPRSPGRREAARRPRVRADSRPAAPLTRLRRARTELDGLGRAAFALVGNLSPFTYAGRIGVRPHPALTAEGGLDVVAPTRFRLRSVPRFGAYVLRGRGADGARDVLHAHDLDRLLIRCDRPLPLEVDGEDLGDVTELLVEVELRL